MIRSVLRCERRGEPVSARRASRVSVSLVLGLIGMALVPAPPAGAGHGAFPISSGIYRIPYADGTDLTVTGDHHTHSPNNRIDMVAGVGASVVAAASGWIRAIIDNHGNSPGAGDGVDVNGNPQDDTAEHSCGNNPGAVVGSCSDYNNYVWIEHPNGEYTKYTHFGTGSVTALGWQVDDWIDAGETLGLEGDVGQATNDNGIANHVHFEAAVATNPGDELTWDFLGGFINNGFNVAPFVCDIAGNLYVDGNSYTANPCDHEPPTADAGGPYQVPEGSTVPFDGTNSSDPENNPLTYLWSLPSTGLDDPGLAEPTYAGVEGPNLQAVVLNVYDQIEALPDSDATFVSIVNVPPDVTANGDAILEGEAATVTAVFTDPGTLDTHSATIDWGDGNDPEAVGVGQLAAGVDHLYGDDGIYDVTVTVTDDDGDSGSDTASVVVDNVAPQLILDTSGAVAFPGGDHFVVEPGADLPISADGSDDGSDDLTFAWTSGDLNTYFNNGNSPDAFPSPLGTYPFAASDDVVASFGGPGVDVIGVTLSDDDGGIDGAELGVILPGTAEDTQGRGWWKHQFGGSGKPHVDEATAGSYLEMVRAVSSVFDESVALASESDAHAVLSPHPAQARARTTAELLVAWLEFAGGAVAWDALVPLQDGTTVPYLELMASAEEAILDQNTTNAELLDIEQQLSRVRHA